MKKLHWILCLGLAALLTLMVAVRLRPAKSDAPITPAATAALAPARAPVAGPMPPSVLPAESGSAPSVPAAESIPAFRLWADAFTHATPAERAAMTAEGVALAQARRPVFKQLIQDHPRRALDEAVPMVVRQELPAEIVALLEERVN